MNDKNANKYTACHQEFFFYRMNKSIDFFNHHFFVFLNNDHNINFYDEQQKTNTRSYCNME